MIGQAGVTRVDVALGKQKGGFSCFGIQLRETES